MRVKGDNAWDRDVEMIDINEPKVVKIPETVNGPKLVRVGRIILEVMSPVLFSVCYYCRNLGALWDIKHCLGDLMNE